jgi:hypothetical protein
MAKVAWDYIVPVKLPADLKGITPGKLPANLLVPVPGGGKLHRLAANAWMAMVAKAKAEGVELKPTSSRRYLQNSGAATCWLYAALSVGRNSRLEHKNLRR